MTVTRPADHTRPPFGRGHVAARRLARVIDISSWFGARLPSGLVHGLAAVGGNLEWALRPVKRRRLAENLVHAVPRADDVDALGRVVRREFVNEAHRSADLLWALGRPQQFTATVELDGIEHGQRLADAGRGFVLLGTHLGGWEVATSVPGTFFSAPTSVITADDWLAWAIEHARATAGLHVLYAGHGALPAARVLQDGGILLMLGDDPRHGSLTHRVRLLDAHADLPAGPVRLARLAQVPIVTFHVVPLARRRWKVIVDEPLEPPERRAGVGGEQMMLQHIADRWSGTIRAWPDHWAASFPIVWSEQPFP